MKLNHRIFLAISLALISVTMVVMFQFLTEIKPGVRQSAEHALFDTAQLLAELAIAPDTGAPLGDSNHTLYFTQAVERFLNRKDKANIHSIETTRSELRIYVTDRRGHVVFDSAQRDKGQDYSQWNDVYLTLKGEYGARTSQEDPSDPQATTMYVAAPIVHNQSIVGVVSVGKPNILSQPFIDLAQTKLKRRAIILGLLFIAVGLLISIWLTRSINALSVYAKAVSEGRSVQLPPVKEKELYELAQAMASMRKALEGKAYIEQYVLALTHEIKSPITAIHSAAELLSQDMPKEDFTLFAKNIRSQAQRIDLLVNRLLTLASLEAQEELTQPGLCSLSDILQNCIDAKDPIAKQNNIQIHTSIEKDIHCIADPLLISQAVDNLLSNAIEFSPKEGEIFISLNSDSIAQGAQAQICIRDQGPGIPPFARERVFERFYSLPRPHSGQKSTGLGLNFAKRIIALHNGEIELIHPVQGLIVKITLPVTKKTSTHGKHTVTT